jgi:hypothetical protein
MGMMSDRILWGGFFLVCFIFLLLLFLLFGLVCCFPGTLEQRINNTPNFWEEKLNKFIFGNLYKN